MGGFVFKMPEQDNTGEYFWLDENALIKNTTDACFYDEYEIIEKIRENKEGYFDFSKNMIDIGACYGAYTSLLDFKYNYAFEPNKEMCCLLYANIQLKNKVYNTDVYNVALDNHFGHTKFDGFACEGSDSPDYNDNYSYTVDVKPLDSYNTTNVGFIKIDVEGFEERVLRGGIGTIIRNNYPPILFECWEVGTCGMTQEKHDKLFDYIKSLGYEIFEFWGDSETHLAINSKYYNS